MMGGESSGKGSLSEAPAVGHANAAFKIIRVKRKRNSEAPDDLVIHSLDAPRKKKHASVSEALQGLGIQTSETTETAEPALKQHRFRKLVTMTAGQLATTAPAQIEQMVSNQPRLAQRKKRDALDANLADRADINAVDLSLVSRSGSGARYEQIRRRRGLTNFEVTEGATDPLRDVATLYDVVRMEKEAADAAEEGHEEGALLCNFLPMVREYLESENKTANTATATTTDTSNSAEDIDEDGYVYDLYIEDAEPHNDESEAWWETHGRGTCPVVHIVDDDTWLVVETSDVDDSDVDSQDSNAEGFIGNDYPDEDGGDAWSSSDGDVDGDGRGLRGRGRGRREWFEESGGESDDDGDW